ncbi:hypothetical protein EZS27_024412 [termite gut metagenome]|uniref:Uncharacterized protein n=1 Tax=termite gut metagenome TaxID=433724 RepID=A0A5J4QX17_9ZZZZ
MVLPSYNYKFFFMKAIIFNKNGDDIIDNNSNNNIEEKKVRKFYSQYSLLPSHSRCCEPVSNSPSLTIPDQALSVQELLFRYTAGTLSSISKIPHYQDGDISFDDFDPTSDPAFDLVDAQEIKESLEAQFAALDAQKKKQLQDEADSVRAKLAEYERIKAIDDERSKEEKTALDTA